MIHLSYYWIFGLKINANSEVRSPDCGKMIHEVSKILTNDTEARKPEKANTNVNNWMCEACDAEKTRQGGKRWRWDRKQLRMCTEQVLDVAIHIQYVMTVFGMLCLYWVCYFHIWYVISIFGMLFPPQSVGSALGGLKKKSTWYP
jgi:hypothetical protein